MESHGVISKVADLLRRHIGTVDDFWAIVNKFSQVISTDDPGVFLEAMILPWTRRFLFADG